MKKYCLILEINFKKILFINRLFSQKVTRWRRIEKSLFICLMSNIGEQMRSIKKTHNLCVFIFCKQILS